MDRAEGPEGAGRIDEEQAERDQRHQQDPGLAARAMPGRALAAYELNQPQKQCCDSRKGMELNFSRGVQQWPKRHGAQIRPGTTGG